MPATTPKTIDRPRPPAPRSAFLHASTDERRKFDRAMSLWDRHRNGEAMPRWSDAFMTEARELREYCIVGSTDVETAAVSVEQIGPHLRGHLKAACPDWVQAASRAAILLKEVVDAAQWLHDGSAPRPVSHVYADHKCPGHGALQNLCEGKKCIDTRILRAAFQDISDRRFIQLGRSRQGFLVGPQRVHAPPNLALYDSLEY